MSQHGAKGGIAALAALWVGTAAAAQASGEPPRTDPALAIPWCPAPPTIDGDLAVGEWQFAATVTLLEEQGSGGKGIAGVVRQEQPVFYVFRDRDSLYVAMDSLDSNTSGIIASCVQHDHKAIIGNDCIEMMIAPGAGEMIQAHDFPVYYVALNALGTVWDAKFFPRYAETHNSWESGVQTVSKVDGTHWTCEMRIPFGAIRSRHPDARVSLYQRPGSALFIVGNVGDEPIEAAIAPDWNALAINGAKAG